MPSERICHRCKESTAYPVLYQRKFYHDFCVERELEESNNRIFSLSEDVLRIEEKKRHQNRKKRR